MIAGLLLCSLAEQTPPRRLAHSNRQLYATERNPSARVRPSVATLASNLNPDMRRHASTL